MSTTQSQAPTKNEQVKTFTFNPDNAPIRVQVINNEPWFVAKDVCDALSIENSRKATASLDDDEKGMSPVVTPSGTQQMTTVSESGLYNLIFQSRKPEARKFRKWVTSEVLPQIRKTGSFTVSANTTKQVSKYRTRGEASSLDLLNLLYLIGECLHHGDQKQIALELGVSMQTVSRTLNGHNRSARVLSALYKRARQNYESLLLYRQPKLMADCLISGGEIKYDTSMPSVKVTTGRGGSLGNQNARKYPKTKGGTI